MRMFGSCTKAMLSCYAKPLFAILGAAALSVGCGGGGGGGAQETVLSGVAAVGAPVAGATVEVFDSKGVKVGTATSSSTGEFSATLSASAVGPFVLKLVKDEILLHAVHPTSASGGVNITPLSDAVTALVSPTGTPTGLIDALRSSTSSAPSAALITEKQDLISTALSPVRSAAGATGNLFTDRFSANGLGADKVLDSVAVSSVADSSTNSATVQITVKVATDPENAVSSPPVVNLTASSRTEDAQAQANSLGTLSAGDLVAQEAASLYAGLIRNLNLCYKDPPSVRTNGTDTVTSDACKKVFFDNDPTQYLNFGQRVARGQQFSGMFSYEGEVKFLPVDKGYLVQDLNGAKSQDGKGRAIVALSWINEHGNRENIMLFVTRYSLGGEDLLGLSGDRNRYAASVASHNQKREWPLRASTLPNLDYVQSSYLFAIRDVTRDAPASTGAKINYVSVSSPSGKTTLLAAAPGGGSRDLAICMRNEVNVINGVPSTPKNVADGRYVCNGTSKSITMAQRFVNPAETRRPSEIALSGILQPLNDQGELYTPSSEVVKNLPNIGVWRVKYFFVGGDSVEQRVWSVARPMTVEELLGPQGPDNVMPRYTAESLAALKSLKTSQQNVLPGCPVNPSFACDPEQAPVPMPASGGIPFSWSSGSIVPVTSIWASGRLNANSATFISSSGATPWDDQLNVLSSIVNRALPCSRQSVGDSHCDNTTVNVGSFGNYNTKSWMSYSELWGKDAEQRSLMRSYNWYQPRKADNTAF